MTGSYKPIYEVLKETIEQEKAKGNSIYSVSFEIKLMKGSSDGQTDIKTIALTIDNPNKAF